MTQVSDSHHTSTHSQDDNDEKSEPEDKAPPQASEPPSRPRRFTHQDSQAEEPESTPVQNQDSEAGRDGEDDNQSMGEVKPQESKIKMNTDSEDNSADEKPAANLEDEDKDAILSDLSAKFREEGKEDGVKPSRPHRFDVDDDASQPRPPVGDNRGSTANQTPHPHSSFQIPSSGVYSGGRQPKSGKLKFFALLLIGLLVIGGSVYSLKGRGGLSFLKGLNPFKPHPTPSPVAQVEETPIPSPTPEFDRSQFKIRVLNGTAKTGLAGSTAEKLKGLGYQIGQTANASNSAFPQTVVLVKPDDASLSAQLIQDLSPQFEASASGTLKPSDPSDGEVILGSI